MKNRIFFPVALAALTAGTGLFSFTRQLEAQQERREAPGPSKLFRFEFKNDGTGRWFQQNGQEAAPEEVQQRRGQLGQNGADRSLGELLRRLMEGHGGAGNLEELFKQAEEGGADDENAPMNPSQEGGSPFNPQRMMEEMLRRMGGKDGDEGGLGFGPGAKEEIPRSSKHHLSALAEWRSLVAQARQSTVRVLKKNRQVALATVVSADGYALTKASEVEKGDFEAEFGNGRIVPCKVVDVMKAYDLALIKLEATGLVAAKFADTDHPVGTLIAAVSTGEDPTGVGVISVAARSLDERSKGALGIVMGGTGIEPPPSKGVLVGKIIPGGAAERAGLLAGDVILSINNEVMSSPRQLQKLVLGLKPEDVVKVSIEREGKTRELELSLGNRAQMQESAGAGRDMRQFDQTALMGSSLSKNASGYPNALQSDLALQAEDAGGPVIDVNGSILGLNIARSERVSTYLIPGKIVNSLLADVQSGKFALSKDADTLNVELREINSTIQKAQEAMKKAEEERDAALKALEKIQKK